jgi:hypothetical protein
MASTEKVSALDATATDTDNKTTLVNPLGIVNPTSQPSQNDSQDAIGGKRGLQMSSESHQARRPSGDRSVSSEKGKTSGATVMETKGIARRPSQGSVSTSSALIAHDASPDKATHSSQRDAKPSGTAARRPSQGSAPTSSAPIANDTSPDKATHSSQRDAKPSGTAARRPSQGSVPTSSAPIANDTSPEKATHSSQRDAKPSGTAARRPSHTSSSAQATNDTSAEKASSPAQTGPKSVRRPSPTSAQIAPDTSGDKAVHPSQAGSKPPATAIRRTSQASAAASNTEGTRTKALQVAGKPPAAPRRPSVSASEVKHDSSTAKDTDSENRATRRPSEKGKKPPTRKPWV